MREWDLPERYELVPAAKPRGRRSPLTDAVHAQDRRGLERRGVKGGRGMRFVMLAEEQLRQLRLLQAVAQRQELGLEQLLLEQLLLQPDRHRRHERPEPARRKRQIGLQQSLELHQRLVVERDVAQVAQRDAAFTKTVTNRFTREPGVMLLAREAFLLRGGDDFAVSQQARGAVVIEGRDT